jgi:hypothetical protein
MVVGILMALLLAPALGDFAHDADPELHALASLPADVRVHIDRAINCAHWSGEEGYDADRRRQIQAALRSLRCDVLDREAARLKRRYANNLPVLRSIDKYPRDID